MVAAELNAELKVNGRTYKLPAQPTVVVCVAVFERFTVMGTSASRHDLSALEVPLRSHGGISTISRPPSCPLSPWERVRVRASPQPNAVTSYAPPALTPALSQRERE